MIEIVPACNYSSHKKQLCLPGELSEELSSLRASLWRIVSSAIAQNPISNPKPITVIASFPVGLDPVLVCRKGP